jgi:hypothetical protein
MNTFDISASAALQSGGAIVVIGPARVDYHLELDSAPQAGHYVQIVREARRPGGRGLLVAEALSRWEAGVVLLTPDIADDGNGHFLQRELELNRNLAVINFELNAQTSALNAQTPYRVLLDSPADPCELRCGKFALLDTLNNVPSTLNAFASAWVLDDNTINSFNIDSKAPRFVCVGAMCDGTFQNAESQSTLLQDAELVWLRAEADDEELRAMAANHDTTVFVMLAAEVRWSERGASVQTRVQPVVTNATEVLWAALIWGRMNGWNVDDCLVFGQLPPSSEAAQGMLK